MAANRASMLLALSLSAGCYASHELREPAVRVVDAAVGEDVRVPPPFDAGSRIDAPVPFDAGSRIDAPLPFDAGSRIDASVPFDAGSPIDAGTVVDAGTPEPLTCANGPDRWASDCPGAMVLYVSPRGSDTASGSAADPMASPHAALVRCADIACHVRIEAGTYALGTDSLDSHCLYVEGGLTADATGAWTREAGATSTLAATGSGPLSSNGDLVVSGVNLTNAGSAITLLRSGRLLVVDDVTVDASYSAVEVVYSSSGVRICNSTLVAGYSAVDVSWSSSDVILDHVDANGGFAGVDVGWSSHDVHIESSTVSGGYIGLSITGGAYDVTTSTDSTVTTRGDYDGGV